MPAPLVCGHCIGTVRYQEATDRRYDSATLPLVSLSSLVGFAGLIGLITTYGVVAIVGVRVARRGCRRPAHKREDGLGFLLSHSAWGKTSTWSGLARTYGNRQFANRFDQRVHNNFGALLPQFDQNDEPRLSFNQRCNEGTARALHKITFPVSGYCSILSFRWPLPDGDSSENPLSCSTVGRTVGPTDPPPGAKVAK